MVKLIMGLSGSGKTKTLVSLVHEAVNTETGDVICIEKSPHLTYDTPFRYDLSAPMTMESTPMYCSRDFSPGCTLETTTSPMCLLTI